jgi:hypothetical protein
MKQLVVSIAVVSLITLVTVIRPGTAHADRSFISGKGATWDCKQDPVVNINHGHGVYTLKGSCKTVNLVGGNNKLTIASSDELNINGGSNTVTIDAVDAINVVGADNTVTYKAAIHGDAPSISKLGNNNVINGLAGNDINRGGKSAIGAAIGNLDGEINRDAQRNAGDIQQGEQRMPPEVTQYVPAKKS